MAFHATRAAVGIGYRSAIADWTQANLERFDVLEITVDHCIHGGKTRSEEIFDLVGRIPLTAHGVGLSIGTDAPLDLAYLDQVAEIVDRLKAPAYSEHLAFTRVPGRDLANLLPLPKTEAVADAIVAKVRTVQSRIAVPFLLENIAYIFEWPDSTMSDAAFFNLICRETGAGLLLDIENLYLNAKNHHLDACAFLDALPIGLVKEVHMAGGISVNDPRLDHPVLADSHSHPVPNEAFALLDYALARHQPRAIIVERDERLDSPAEILDDVTRIRACLDRRQSNGNVNSTGRRSNRLLGRQVELLGYLTSPAAIFNSKDEVPVPPSLRSIEPALLHLEARFSFEKRVEKIVGVLPRTIALLANEQEEAFRAFAEACPPTSIGRIETARQFCDFLSDHWRHRSSVPAYLCDVAACELALSSVRGGPSERDDRDAGFGVRAISSDRTPRAIRRAQGAVLLRCSHNVQVVFESGSVLSKPVQRDTWLAIAAPPDSADPLIFEVPAVVFDLLMALDDWTEQSLFGATIEAKIFVADLVSRGILDARA
jgi:uncharacterized protein